MRARIRVGSGGEVRGDGSATLRPGAGCDFPSAQVQADGVRLAILGVREGDALRLRFRVREVEPPGAQDLGGFVRLVPRLTITIEERDGAEVERPGRLEPPDGEIYAAVTRIRLAARRS